TRSPQAAGGSAPRGTWGRVVAPARPRPRRGGRPRYGGWLARRRPAVRPAAQAGEAGRPRRPAGSGASRPLGRIGRRRERAVDRLLRVAQLLPLLLEQRVRLLVREHDVRREEDRDFGALAGE